MKKILASALAIALALLVAGCGPERPPVDPEKAKTVHKYRGGGKRAQETATQEGGGAVEPADDAPVSQ